MTFNVAINAMIWHWLMVVAAMEVGYERVLRVVQRMASFIYTDKGLLASTWLEWLQGAFNAPKELFDWVSIWMNVGNMVGMVYQPCHAVGRHSEEEYAWRMKDEGILYQACL